MKKYFSITSVFFVFATFLFVMTGVVSGADTNNLGISDISASKFGTSYRISWHVNTTNRTYSKVYYGKTFPLNLATAEYTTNYCSTSYPCITVGDSPYQLSPNTTYYYRVATSPLSSPTLESYEYGPESTQYSFTTSANSGGSAPAVPLSLAVGLEGGTQNNVLVSWTENSTNERSIDVRRTGPGAEVITTVNVSYNYPVSFVDVAVPYADYAYSIRACNEYGCSAYTSPVNITVSSTPVPVVPTAPTSLSQTSTPGVQSITLQWIDNAGNEDRFNLERRTSGGTWSVVSQSISANSISYIDTSAVSGVSYDYRIQACLGTSCSDYLSLSGATIIAPTAPPTPQSLGASASACTATTPTVNLSWSGVTSPTGVSIMYKVYRGGESTPLATGVTTTSFTDASVARSTAYTYTVRAYYLSSGTEILSELSTATSAVTVPARCESASVSFDASPSSVVSGYPSTLTWLSTNATTCTASGAWSGTKLTSSYQIVYPTVTSTYYLTCAGSGGSQSQSVTVKVSNPVKLTGVKILKGIVTYPNGNPVSDAEIIAYRKGTGQSISATTDSLGKYELLISGGVWDITVRPRGVDGLWSAQNPYDTMSYNSGNMDETKTLDVKVNYLDSKISISVRDSFGQLVSGVVVRADSDRGNSSSDDYVDKRNTKTGQTDSGGAFVLNNPAGTYNIRITLPVGYKAVSTLEEKVVLGVNENKNLSFVIEKEVISDTLTVSGTTKLEDGTGTTALVWAWSEDGGHKQTTSSEAGDFTIGLTKGQVWHVGAGKDLELGSYKSTEITLDTKIAVKPVSLILAKHTTETPPSVTITAKATEAVVASGVDGAKVSLPAGSAGNNGNVSVLIRPTVEVPSQESSTAVSTVYDITVKNNSGQNISTLSSEAEIIIPYDEVQLKNKGVKVEDITPGYFDESKGVWVSVTNYRIDREKKIFILKVKHFTRFALIASADIVPPESPTSVVVTVSAPGKIKVDWKNPTNDVKHSKVYRSTVSGDLGKVVATVVITNSFIDEQGLENGKTYYYTVRSVDSAGNESNNISQISIVTSASFTSLAQANINAPLLLPPGQALKGEILRNLSVGSTGEDVKSLQTVLLNEGVYPSGLITGYFGQMTFEAVKRFQEKYSSEILVPADLTSGNGYVGVGTRKKINSLLGKQTSEITTSSGLLRNLSVGSTGEDVKSLQTVLLNEGVYPSGLITGYFGQMTFEAVKRFQEKYSSEILVPADLTSGNGYVGVGTRKKVNQLLSK